MKTATWVSEHSVQNNGVAAYISKYCRYIHRQDFADGNIATSADVYAHANALVEF